MSLAKLLNDREINDEPRFYGVTVGIVTDIDDPENLGRIKVKLIGRDNARYETEYIRITSPMVGANWGMFFFPEIGDEVLVAFGDGNIHMPYVIGSLWNRKDNPPVNIVNRKNEIRKIKTKNGNELTFTDELNKNSIEIKTPKDLTIFLDDDKDEIKIKDRLGKNMVHIDTQTGVVKVLADNKITLDAGQSSIELNGTAGTMVIDAAKSITMKATQITLKATNAVDITATSDVTVKATGSLTLKGAIAKIN